MASYTIPRSVDTEIAGPSSELVGKLVALRVEGTAQINTTYGVAPATRVTAVEITKSGPVSLGLRLIFWSQVRKALGQTEATWTVGRITVTPQSNDPDRTVYLLEPPADKELPLIAPALDAFENVAPF